MTEELDLRTVNLKRVSETTELSSVVRLLALTLMGSSYIMPGDYLKKMSDTDLAYLMDVCESVRAGADNLDRKISELILISEMLCMAEGIPSSSDRESTDNVNALMLMITCASLARKGLIEAIYENFSFGPDMGSVPMAKAL